MSLRNVLVVISLLLSLAIGLAPRGRHEEGGGPGAGGQAMGHAINIGLSLDTLKEERWQGDRDAFVARAKELGASVHVESANSDDAVQVQNVTGMLSTGVDVVVIAPHDARAMAQAVKLCHDKGVPVIAYDRLIRDCDLDLYLTFDNVRVGHMQGQYIVDQLPRLGHKPMRLVRIYGSKTDNNAALFKQGQDEVLQPHIENGDIVVVAEDWADDWRPENAKRIMNAALTKTHDIDAVLASNDGTAGGAVQALSEEKLAGKVVVTGQDAELVACQRIAQGTQAMTVYKPLKNLANRAAELAVSLGKRKPVVANGEIENGHGKVPTVMLDIFTVTRDSLMDTVVKDNFHSKEEVYGK